MIVEIAIALVVGLVGTVVVGTLVRGMLGLHSAVNWFLQTATLGAAVYFTSWPTALQAGIIVAFPTFIHALNLGMRLLLLWRVQRGDYGEPAMWAYELFQEEDEEFVRAQANLSKQDVMEAKVIAESKQQLREIIVDRHESNQNT